MIVGGQVRMGVIGLVAACLIACRREREPPRIHGGPRHRVAISAVLRDGTDSGDFLVRHFGVRWEAVACGRPSAGRGVQMLDSLVAWSTYREPAPASWRSCMEARLAADPTVESWLFDASHQQALEHAIASRAAAAGTRSSAPPGPAKQLADEAARAPAAMCRP